MLARVRQKYYAGTKSRRGNILIFHKCDLHHLTSIGAVNTLRAIELTN